MMMNKHKPQWSDIRKSLLLLNQNELVAQIKDLYTMSGDSRRFLESRFAQDRDQCEAVLTDFKQEITDCFFWKAQDQRRFAQTEGCTPLDPGLQEGYERYCQHPGSEAALCGDRHGIHQYIWRYQRKVLQQP